MRVLHVVFLATTWVFASTQLASAVSSDNVILVVVDDFGVDKYDDTATGNGLNSVSAIAVPSTPVLRGLADDGLYFRRAYASYVCSPTRANMQTGRYPGRTGIGVGTSSVDPEAWTLQLSEWTLPEMLNSDPTVGPVATGFFGKWHLSGPTTGGDSAPNQQGYDFAWHTDGNLIAPDNYYAFEARRQGQPEIAVGYATTLTVNEAVEWMQGAPEPFFAVVSLHAPHAPWHVAPWHLVTSPKPFGLTAEQQPLFLYNNAVEALDTELGRMLDELGPLRDRTNVIVMGDNGTPQEVAIPPYLPEHAKGTAYNGSVHVPLIVNGPAVQNPGRTTNGLAHAVDVFATVADLMGVDYASHLPNPTLQIDSVSLLPYLQDQVPGSLRSMIYTERFRPNGVELTAAESVWQGAYNGRYRVLKVYDYGVLTQVEMYDLIADPFESQDLLLGTLTSGEQAIFMALNQGIADIVGTY